MLDEHFLNSQNEINQTKLNTNFQTLFLKNGQHSDGRFLLKFLVY